MYVLRELERKDLLAINSWRRNKELIDFLGAPYRFINPDVDGLWFENYMKNRNTSVRCAIVEVENNDNILGIVSLVNINYINKSAEFHIMIGENKNQNKGIGYFATKEILKHAFNDLNLERIELSVLQENERAINLYKKIGFVEEGCKRNSVYKNGKYVNMIIMAILKDEFF